MVTTLEERGDFFVKDAQREIHDFSGKFSIGVIVFFPKDLQRGFVAPIAVFSQDVEAPLIGTSFLHKVAIAPYLDEIVELSFDNPMRALHIALKGFGSRRNTPMFGLEVARNNLNEYSVSLSAFRVSTNSVPLSV